MTKSRFTEEQIAYALRLPESGSPVGQPRYLFVAIDRATRWVYPRTYRDPSEASSSDFLRPPPGGT